ncbi:uncharacterized protein METZ01_LOCUS423119 [marine metagenome]|uniref:Uncharacterized protein n=1 Tax=marine metagenome TaxID=408172 RepID=A0A382XI35_9ZZZZ
MGAAILKECDMDYARKLLDFGLRKKLFSDILSQLACLLICFKG